MHKETQYFNSPIWNARRLLIQPISFHIHLQQACNYCCIWRSILWHHCSAFHTADVSIPSYGAWRWVGNWNEEGRWRVEAELSNSWQHLCLGYDHNIFWLWSKCWAIFRLVAVSTWILFPLTCFQQTMVATGKDSTKNTEITCLLFLCTKIRVLVVQNVFYFEASSSKQLQKCVTQRLGALLQAYPYWNS